MKVSVLILFVLVSAYQVFGNEQRIINSNLLIAPALYKQILATEQDNFVFSTLSVELALDLLEMGSKQATSCEILQALQLRFVSNSAIANGSKELSADLVEGPGYNFTIANGVFLQKNYTVQQSFLDVAKDSFNAEIENLDFSKNTASANAINSWVAQITHGRIQGLVPASSLSAATRLVLVNALYFAGNFQYPLRLATTKQPENFYSFGKTVKVNMMVLEGKLLEYVECHTIDAKLVKMPITGGNAKVVIILPNKRNGLKNLEKTPERIFTPRNFTPTAVNVKMPKYVMQTAINLVPILKSMGMNSAFKPGVADLSGIASTPGDLYVSFLSQKAYFNLTEKGVEGAAATATGISATSVIVSPVEPIQVTVNHPCIIFLEIKNVVTFVTRLVDPSTAV